MDLSSLIIQMSPFLVIGVSSECFLFYCIFIRKSCMVNSADPVQMPHSAASELDLQCLHLSPKWVSGLKKANTLAAQ